MKPAAPTPICLDKEACPGTMNHTVRIDFDREVIKASLNLPVLVQFGTPWSLPGKALEALLDRVAAERAGRLRVVRIDASQRPELAALFGVHGTPAVIAFRDGQPVGAFAGVPSENRLRAFVAQVLPAPGVDEVIQGRAHLRAGRWQPAADLLRVALAVNPAQDAVRADYVRALARLDRPDEAWRAWLPLRRKAESDPALAALGAWLEAREAAGELGSEQAARDALAAAPHDSAARHRLAQWLIGQERWGDALDELIEIVQHDRAFGDDLARRTALAVFELCGDAALVGRYRRRLASALN